MTKRTVWGHVVETDARGRNWWPAELKDEVVRRIVHGQRIAALAEELGTTPVLVRKWWRKLRPEGYSLTRVEDPFTEVHVVDVEPVPAGSTVVSSSRFTVNGITLEVQRDIALADLTVLLQAMGSVR
jgi:transposase-like protein